MERCNEQNSITEEELDCYFRAYSAQEFCDIFYYNLQLIYRLAEYTCVDAWGYSLDLQDFLNENDFGDGWDIFMWIVI